MIFWIVYTFIFEYDIQGLYSEKRCNLLFCSIAVFDTAPAFAIVMFSVNRYCTIVHTRQAFFKTKSWIAISIESHWILAFLTAIPIAPMRLPVSIHLSLSGDSIEVVHHRVLVHIDAYNATSGECNE